MRGGSGTTPSDRRSRSGMRWKSPLIATAILIVLMAGASFLAARYITDFEEEQSFTRLRTEADNLAQTIQSEMMSDREELRILASQAALHDDPSFAEFQQIMDDYANVGSISRLEMLLPDDTVLTSDGRRIDASGTLSFADEAAKGAHISDRTRDTLDPNSYVVRNFVPVTRDGQTVAMLYGVIELGTLPETLEATPYDGQAALYLIDGSTGDFLVDTWHPGQTGNIWDLGSREMAPGYNDEQLRQDLQDGRSGYVVFVSQSIGEYLYFYFQPTGINAWSVALSVPESLVFERANAIRDLLNLFLGFEAVCFVAYFAWMLLYVRRETNVKQGQLNTINYIYDVEKLLFSAHEDQSRVSLALEKVGSMTGATHVGLWLFSDDEPRSCFLWYAPGIRRTERASNAEEGGEDVGEQSIPSEENRRNLSHLMHLFKSGETELVSIGRTKLARSLPCDPGPGVTSLIAVPIIGPDGELRAVLTARNVSKGADAAPLHSVELSLGMFCGNLRTYRSVKQRGETDALSGLFNRNRYEQDRPHLVERCTRSLSCIYIDVNGLHELNNAQGHDAGDTMLRAVASQIRKTFGAQGAYRIGGDEFVVFAFDQEESDVTRAVADLEQSLEQKGVRVSTGMQHRTLPLSIDELIKGAETKMYQEKRRFYEQAGNDRRAAR